MTRFTTKFAAVAICLFAATAADAQVTARSYSNGGTAVATANGRGNTRLNATAVARNGGFARANMIGRGVNGGFASGRSTAIANGGVAISNGRSIADGWGARSDADSRARSNFGFSRSDSTAIARGPWSNATAESRATGRWGEISRSNSRAIDDRRYRPQPQPWSAPTYAPAVEPYFGSGFGN